MQAEAEHSKREEILQSDPAHMLNRNQSTQDITEVYDVTSKGIVYQCEDPIG